MSANFLTKPGVAPVVTTAPRMMLRRSSGEMTFDSRIPAELAACLRDPKEVLSEYGYSGADAFALVSSHVFQVELKRCVEEVSQGLTFRRRAQIMGPDVLEHAYEIATDKEASAAVRLEAQKWIAKMGDLEPKEKGTNINDAFQLVINL